MLVKTVGVVTSSRADYGIVQPVLTALNDHPDLEPYLYATGMHLAPAFGNTVEMIVGDGFRVDEKLESLMASDTPESVARTMGNGVSAFAQSYARFCPDFQIVVGDRFEMLPAALAALPFHLPVAHIHGGELTRGAMDESIRHSLTKLSHLHFVSTLEYGRRVEQLGEEPWRIVVSGAPSLDKVHALVPMSRSELEQEFGLDLSQPPVLVTYHPVTLEPERSADHVDVLLGCLEEIPAPVVFSGTNADPGYSEIHNRVVRYVSEKNGAYLVPNFGSRGYFSMLRYAAAMVGNSSSGIIESGSFSLPVVNIGSRQQGRVRGENVIDVGYDRASVAAGISRALDPEFRRQLQAMKNPYGDGNAAALIVDKLADMPLDDALLMKCFHDIETGHD